MTREEVQHTLKTTLKIIFKSSLLAPISIGTPHSKHTTSPLIMYIFKLINKSIYVNYGSI